MIDTDKLAAEKTHEVIEAAKKAHAADAGMTFVQHLEAAARDLCRPADEWRWSTSVRHGVWHISIEAIVVRRGNRDVTDDVGGLL